MNTPFVEEYNESVDLLKFNPQPIPIFLGNQQNNVDGIKQNQPFQNHDVVRPDSFPSTDLIQKTNPSPFSCMISDGDSLQVPDFPDDCLKFISEILMEEDLDGKLGTFHDYSDIQATEKLLYDALGEAPRSTDHFPSFHDQLVANPDNDFERSSSSHGSSSYSTGKYAVYPDCILSPDGGETSQPDVDSLTSPLGSDSHFSSSSSIALGVGDAVRSLPVPASPVGMPLVPMLENEGEFDWFNEVIKHVPENCTCNSGTGGIQILKDKQDEVAGQTARSDNLIDGSKGRKTHQRDENDNQDSTRSNKLLAAYDDVYVQMEQYDDVMLWKEGKDDSSKAREKRQEKSSNSKARKTRGKKQTHEEELVDLRILLNVCGQAVASFDMRNANELLKQIRQHSSPYGDSMERIAHYLANGLEARIAGTGSHLSMDVVDNRLPFSDILKAYRTYVQSIPLRRTSYYVANQTIANLAENVTTIHVIDFGIFLGFQWPSFIQCLSKRPSGPPNLRITGIGFPQRGFKPAAIVEETGKRLDGYCKRFNVPFEYHPIAKKWDELSSEDIKLNRDELVVVNCLYESRALLDETFEDESPRDAFLRLIRNLNPDIFIHGIISGTLNASFFMTRFREALFHYSTIFDMLEATIPREDPDRLLIERELYGKAVLNVIGCEGVERLERPETYKQWQVRTLRAGFRQIPVDQDLVGLVKEKMKANYHKDFVIGEDAHWMVQGWKGRILYAMSCWRPA